MAGVAFSLFVLLSCSSAKEDPACQQGRDKLASCQIGASLKCSSSSTSAELCAVHCVVDASCVDLSSTDTKNAYFQCLVACAGFGADSFVCRDGTRVLDRSLVCDGVVECFDGSDEQSCSDGGVDGGSDGGSATRADGGRDAR